MHPDDLPPMIEALQLGIEEENPEIREARLRSKSGKYITMEFRGAPLYRNTEKVGFLGIGRDVTERNRAEEALQESERRFREIFNNVSDEILLTDSNGVMVYVNDSCWDVFGYRTEEIIGRKFTDLDLFEPDELSRMIKLFTDSVARPHTTRTLIETRAKHKDGHIIPLEIKTKPIVAADGTFEGFVNIIRDITRRKRAEEALQKAHDELEMRVEERTAELAKANEELQTEIAERKRAEETLRESEQRYRLLAENVTDVIVSTDMNLKPTYMSPSVTRLLGYTVEESMARTVEEGLTPASRKVAMADMDTEMALERKKHGDPSKLRLQEFEFYRKDGSTVWVEVTVSFLRDPDGNPIGLVNVLRDITERRQVEEELRRSEEHFRALIENSSDGITILNADGTLRYESPSIGRMLGYGSGGRIGQTSFELIHPDDLPNVTDAFAQLVQNPGGTSQLEVRILHSDGSWRTLEVVGRNLLDDPVVAGIVVNQRDITERMKAEEEKQQMEQQLQLTGRLAAVGELAAGVAHELNNPLAAVQGFAQFLASREDLDETIKNDVQTIYKEAQRASKITANLLAFARRHKPEKRLISINEVLEKSLELHTYRMRVNDIEVLTELAPDLPKTMADFYQLQQVFMNLITNAEHAMTVAHGRGKLTVKTQKAGKTIQAIFTDDGPGIPEANMGRIFDPFFTTKEVGKGMGLGLSICYGVVQEHGGHIYAKRMPDKGTTFVVELPVVTEDTVPATNPVRSNTRRSKIKKAG